ncbi:MAG: hypothetical protein P1S60_00035 [Anaerolineae bacterium]|nr:hypothetical protein [Anaerolineae bacterium]
MALTDRNRQMRVVAEILLVHLPELIDQDQDLARDLLSVAGTALRDIYEDAEQSAKAWDKKAYHVRADAFRREWDWSLGASNYALGLAAREKPLSLESLTRFRQLIRPKLEKPARRQIPDPTRFRGAAQAVRDKLARQRKPVRW